jgi:TonB-linked SusC/RagA family outer membrane protein
MKQKIYTLFIGLFLIFVGTTALAQSVSGTVKAEDDGLGIPGVSVIIKGTTRATITDIEGNYTIGALKGETIVFSLVGYQQQEINYSDGMANPMVITLKGGSIGLNEVVITDVLGLDRDKRQLGYSAQRVEGKEIAEINRENFMESLQSRVSGLTVNSTGGSPGSSSQIILRAATSFSQDNQPLFIVDGVPINNRTFNQGALVSDKPNRDLDYSSPISDINPNDIESINILKGPEASALYGFYGANGAIVITTKKGKAGPGKLSYSANFGVSELYRFPEIQKEYGQGFNSTPSDQYRRHFGPKYPAGTTLFDNIGNFFEKGSTSVHNLSFEGGKDKTSYRISGNYTDNKGVIPTTRLQRYNLSVRGSTKLLDDKLEISGTATMIQSDNIKSPRGAGGLFTNLLLWPAVDDARNFLLSDGSRRRLTTAGNDTEFDNPFFDIYKNKNTDKTDRSYSNINVTYTPMNWLSFSLKGGYDFSTMEGESFAHPESQRGLGSRGIIEKFTYNSRVFNTTGFVSLKKDIGKLNTTFRVGAALDQQKYNTLAVSGSRLVIPELISIQNADPTTMRNKQTNSTRRSSGFFGELTFDYSNFLTVSGTIRNDRTSTLNAPNNSFYYPGASVSLAFSELMKNVKWLDFGKLRFSLAGSGRDVPPYNLKSDLAPQLTTGGGYALGFTGNSPNLRPEIVQSFSVGTELNFLKNRIGLELTYFNQKNNDQIMRLVRLSYGTGYVLQNFNGGTSSAEGIEATLSLTPVKGKDFEWTSIFNFYKGRTRIVDFPADIPEFYVSDTWLYSNVRSSVFRNQSDKDNTYSMTTLAGFTYQRNTKGELLISPTSGLPLINTNFSKIGDRQPDFNLGIVNKFRYKGFSLSIALDIRKGGDIYNGNGLYLWSFGLHPNQADRETPRVVPGVLADGKQESDSPTANTIQVTPYYNNDYYRLQFAEESFIEKDINWLRVRDARLAYNLPSSLLKSSSIFKSVTVYVGGTDLFLITNYSGADPNVNGVTPGVGGVGGAGFDYGTLSTPRVINFGFNIGF